MNTNPLFIPLMKKHYDNFKSGKKKYEYRKAGPRWNKDTCYPGRPVVLSCGYGKKNRMRGVILSFTISTLPCKRAAWKEIYGNHSPAACIRIKIL